MAPVRLLVALGTIVLGNAISSLTIVVYSIVVYRFWFIVLGNAISSLTIVVLGSSLG